MELLVERELFHGDNPHDDDPSILERPRTEKIDARQTGRGPKGVDGRRPSCRWHGVVQARNVVTPAKSGPATGLACLAAAGEEAAIGKMAVGLFRCVGAAGRALVTLPGKNVEERDVISPKAGGALNRHGRR
ncbi:hypothetical protein [Chitiniphilus shinanonensis]|uniref:hypothetical protein n=1 Tax=Chitiniphilus shinanonensis TaxID=553088 RepID=UPI0012F75B5B|nr:hypothetical protein [Chitiniphilus shinanonensis]